MQIYAYILIFLIAGCKTSEDGDVIVDGPNFQGHTVDQDDFSHSVVPMSLWSPQQRRATSGFYFLVAEKSAYVERDAKKALELYEAAYNLDPNAFLGGKMIGAKAAAGEKELAIADARKMVLLYPKDAKLRFLFGRLLAEMGNHSDAEKQLEVAIDIDKEYEPPYLELIQLHQMNQDSTKAFLISKELTENIPSSLIGWSNLSRYYLAKNQYKEAIVFAKRAYLMAPHNPTVTQIYAILLQLTDKKKQAVHIYEQLYRLNPTDEQLTAQMIDLYRELGNLDEALELIDDMLSIAKTDVPGIEMQKALILWELNRFDEASELLLRLSDRHPNSDRLKYMAGASLERKEQYDLAMEKYKEIPNNSPFYYKSAFRIVVILSTQKKIEEARKAAIALTELEQVEWDAWRLLGGHYAEQENFEEAVKVFEEGFKKFPTAYRLLFLKGVYQEKSEDINGCIATMRQVIEKDPANSSAYNYLGYLFAEQAINLEEAERLIQKALELKPNDGFYLDSLGWVYYQMGNLKKAKPIFEKALKIEPEEGVIMEHLADVIRKSGDLEEARKFYLKALEIKISGKDKERVEGKIDELNKKGE